MALSKLALALAVAPSAALVAPSSLADVPAFASKALRTVRMAIGREKALLPWMHKIVPHLPAMIEHVGYVEPVFDDLVAFMPVFGPHLDFVTLEPTLFSLQRRGCSYVEYNDPSAGEAQIVAARREAASEPRR